MKKAHIKVMDKLLGDIQDEIFFSKVIELDTKTIYVSYLWDIRIIIDDIKKEVVFIGEEVGYNFRWTTKTIADIQNILNVIISRIEGCY